MYQHRKEKLHLRHSLSDHVNYDSVDFLGNQRIDLESLLSDIDLTFDFVV